MANLRESALVTGSQALRSYEKQGVHRQAEGVTNIQRFHYDPNLPANTKIQFKPQSDIQILSFWASLNTGVITTVNDAINLEVYEGTILAATFTLSVQSVQRGRVLVWEVPLIAFDESYNLHFYATVGLNNISMFFKEVFLGDDIIGALVT